MENPRVGECEEWRISPLDRINYSRIFSASIDFSSDEIPDWWEQKYFGGVTRVIAGHLSGNDGFTYLDTYIAGVSPFTYDPFVAGFVPAGNGLIWTPVESRLYSVYWTPSLTNAFTLLQGDIPYPQSEFIDSSHSEEVAGFYRLKVQIQ